MSESAVEHSESPGLTRLRQAGLAMGLVFSLLVIYSISFGLLDEANTRFGAIAFGFAIVLLSSPLDALNSSGKRSAGRKSIPRRSRIVLLYSSRVSRRAVS